MAAIVWSDVVNLAPEMADVPAGAQEIILAHVNAILNPNEFRGEDSPFLRLARIYLAAHYGTITMQGSDGPGGPVIAESAGGLSRSYGLFSPAGSDPTLDTTPYGKAFRSLVAMSPARAPRAL
jgi:hypothetical protein